MSEPDVRPFAFMRLTHEALRSGFTALREAAAAGDLTVARSSFEALRAVIDLHALQEEEVFFPLLDDKFDGVVRQAGLREAHVREHAHQRAVETALARGDAASAHAAIEGWAGSFETHLQAEEDVMMPLTEKVAPTLEGRAAHVRQILEVDWRALKSTQLPYVLGELGRTKPYGPLRMYVAALQVSAADAWSELEPIVRATLSDTQIAQLTAHGHLSASS